MIEQDILKTKPKKLTQSQREEFFRDGGLCVEGLINEDWVKKLNNAVIQFNEDSKKLDKSNTTYDLQPGHTKENPKLRRVTSPCDFNEDLWKILISSNSFCTNSGMINLLTNKFTGEINLTLKLRIFLAIKAVILLTL